MRPWVLCEPRNVPRPPGAEPCRPKPEGCWTGLPSWGGGPGQSALPPPEVSLAQTPHSTHRAGLDDLEAITSYVQEMSAFLMGGGGDQTETRVFLRSFVKGGGGAPWNATIRYTIPMPEDSPIGGRDAREIGLGSPVLSTVHHSGPCGTVLQTFELILGL